MRTQPELEKVLKRVKEAEKYNQEEREKCKDIADLCRNALREENKEMIIRSDLNLSVPSSILENPDKNEQVIWMAVESIMEYNQSLEQHYTRRELTYTNLKILLKWTLEESDKSLDAVLAIR